MAQSLAQFGQTIKAKYPQYQDIPDEELANKVLAKYPQYRDMVEQVAGAGPLGLPQPNSPAVPPALRGGDPVAGYDTVKMLRQFEQDHPKLNPVIQAGIGAAKGGMNTVGHLGAIIGLGSPDLEQVTKANNTAQAIGKGGEQAGEFIIPGAAEETLAAKAAPYVGKLLPIAKMGLASLGSGAVNAAQGGSFTTGALAGGVGSGVSQGIAKTAPAFAESALRVTGNDKTYGRTVGRAILDDTRGIRPGTVERTARETVSQLTPQVEQIAADAGAAGSRGSLVPARDAVTQVAAKHTTNRAVNSAAELQPLQNFLENDAVTGLPLAPNQTPTGLLQLKRGVDADFIGNWNPNLNSNNQLDTAKSVYGKLADQFHLAAPGTKEIDQRISSLIPVMDRAQRAERGAGILENTMNRFRAPTGALVGAATGGAAGYEHSHSLPEAAAGAVAGALLPSTLAAPETQMLIARMANSVPRYAPVLTGGVLQATRKAK